MREKTEFGRYKIGGAGCHYAGGDDGDAAMFYGEQTSTKNTRKQEDRFDEGQRNNTNINININDSRDYRVLARGCM